ncbi:hypothetical protein [Propionicimonas sp.]|uniref:hypothetical protein n=1 Tax=Propionicimonas sp. TaxID=1955623 RepID=UPI0017C2086D|nr:hypothetical protein [Propionicimonas sp.]MBU3977500.1 hypothetical protein [Actinomycetota bacterium]MBA3021425.1 hypothetical protein [Propionicimonas sp.]MBU3986010.1 hypothetical protein [Actinomycetota bacterium]MBU4008795.1 hypothetical protein [Actinomycetota bacterium]MBU4066055.1 hypothetical protein [Actinomycetota bacterium]
MSILNYVAQRWHDSGRASVHRLARGLRRRLEPPPRRNTQAPAEPGWLGGHWDAGNLEPAPRRSTGRGRGIERRG